MPQTLENPFRPEKGYFLQYQMEELHWLEKNNKPAHAAILALLKVADYRLEETPLVSWLEGTMTDAELNLVLNLWRPCEGCVPEDEFDSGADVLAAIMVKFRLLLQAAMKLSPRIELLSPNWKTVIEPSTDDATTYAIVDFYQETRPYCYYLSWQKAWHVKFSCLEDLASEILEINSKITTTLVHLNPA